MSTVTHGTSTAYQYGCRCDRCREAQRRYSAERRAALKGALTPDDPRHGRTSTYVSHGCRCDLCKAAMTTYQRELKARRLAALLEADSAGFTDLG